MCRGDLEEERRKRGKPVRRLMVVVKRVGVTGEDAGVRWRSMTRYGDP